MAAETTTTLSNEMSTYYEKVFLKRNKYELVMEEGSQKQTQSQGEGKALKFNRYTPLATATTPLSEGSNPSKVSLTSSTVTATLAEYGNSVRIGKFLSLTSVDLNNKEKISLVGQNMAETIDELARNELENGTVRLAGGKSAVSDLAASDVFNYTEIKKIVRTLEGNKAMLYDDGFFMGKVQPFTKYDIVSDSAWLNAKTYSDVKDLYRGEMGELGQVRFSLTKNGKTTASTTTVYHNYVHGANAFGTYDLSGDQPKLYIVPNTQIDSNNPTGRFSIVSWAGSYAAKVLVSTWIIVEKAGATA